MLATRQITRVDGLHQVLFQTLRRLGGSVGVNYCCHDGHGGIQEVQAVFVSCSREAWVGAFGKPRRIRRHFDPVNGRWLSTWEHQLLEGSVRFLGYSFERSPGSHWVVVKQLRALQDGNDGRSMQ
jgi:hypothetical protein